LTDSEKKGFEGLSSLISDVEKAAPEVGENKPKKEVKLSDSLTTPETTKEKDAWTDKSVNTENPYREPKSNGASKWIWGIFITIGLIIWGANNSNNQTNPRKDNNSYEKYIADNFGEKQSKPKAITLAQLKFEKPPVGRNKILSTAQIRWCLRYKILLDSQNEYLSSNYNVSKGNVDQYNNEVAEYNSRCGEFRYRAGQLERAKREIDAVRHEILFLPNN